MVMTRNIGKRVDIEVSSCSEGSSRRLVARQDNTAIDEVNLFIVGKYRGFGAQSAGGNAVIQIDRLTAIDFAVKLLESLQPSRLAKAKFSDTPVGTYLRNKIAGEIVRVVEWDSSYSASYGEQTDSVVAAVKVGGDQIVPWQNPHKDRADWEVVEVEEKTVKTWTVK